jgi:SAM-dependent methyltransferase
MEIKLCRWCKQELSHVLSLGEMPIVNYFPQKNELKYEKKYPLDLNVCHSCGLAQLGFIIEPEKLFADYHYYSHASQPLVKHLRNLAKDCQKRFHLNHDSRVLDIGCNDGTYLSEFHKRGIYALGIDPSEGAAVFAKKEKIAVINTFFTHALAKKMIKDTEKFDLISAAHTLANIVDLDDFIRGVKLLLKEKGVVVIEVGSLAAMLTKGSFDSIYHEHYSYFSLSVLQKILRKHDLHIFLAEKNDFHGGALRVYATHKENKIPKKSLLKENITDKDFIRFAKYAIGFQKKLKKIITNLAPASIVGYGAPAKGVTLLNYCNLDGKRIQFIVDSTDKKQGRYVPGVHIPVYPEEYIKNKKVDYVLLLSWNYKYYIFKKLRKMMDKNVKIIIPFPLLKSERLYRRAEEVNAKKLSENLDNYK